MLRVQVTTSPQKLHIVRIKKYTRKHFNEFKMNVFKMKSWSAIHSYRNGTNIHSTVQ